MAKDGRVATSINAGLRPPPPAAYGVDSACHPADDCHQEADGKVRPIRLQMSCRKISLRHLCADPDRRSHLRLIAKWLKVGITEDGRVTSSCIDSPGCPIGNSRKNSDLRCLFPSTNRSFAIVFSSLNLLIVRCDGLLNPQPYPTVSHSWFSLASFPVPSSPGPCIDADDSSTGARHNAGGRLQAAFFICA